MSCPIDCGSGSAWSRPLANGIDKWSLGETSGTAGADRIWVFARFYEHLGNGTFVKTVMLKNEKPATDPAVLVNLRPHAGHRGLCREQRARPCKHSHNAR